MRARACDIHRIYIKRRALATPQMDLSCRKASRLLTRAGGHLRSFTSHLTSLYLLGGGGAQHRQQQRGANDSISKRQRRGSTCDMRCCSSTDAITKAQAACCAQEH
jgi:hypothetical protein